MNVAGVGRSGGLTNWHLMDVASMWACLVDQDTTNHWRQVAGWRKICDLAQTHLGRLQEYRRGLAEAWPPETNEASRAYIAELDQLIDQVRRTHDAAATNYTALSAATQAIGTTRETLRQIYDEYAVKLQQKRAYETTAADPKAVLGSRVTEPPVTDVELERLNVRARGIMYGLSSELQQAQVMLRQPPPARQSRDPGDPDVYGASAAPIIPPIVPLSMPTSPVTSSTPLPRSPVQPAPTATAPSVGPVLGGAGTAVTPTVPNPGPPTVGPPATPNPASGMGVPPPLSAGANRPRSIEQPSGQPSQIPRTVGGVSGGQPAAIPSNTSRPMPPGGLIGGAPGMGLTQPGANNPQPRRVNPIGGVIGGGGAGTAPTGGAGSRPGGGRGFGGAHGVPPIGGAPLSGPTSMGAANGMHGRRQQKEFDEEAARKWDPQHPWETDEGVPPVVLPPDEDGPIDPGPAIGFNR